MSTQRLGGMGWQAVAVVGGVALSAMFVSAEEPAPLVAPACDEALVGMLETRYAEYVDALEQGEPEAAAAFRTAAMQASSRMPEQLSTFKRLACASDPTRVRAVYRRDNQSRLAPAQPMADFLHVTWEQEDKVWKLGAIQRANRPKFQADGSPTVIGEIIWGNPAS